MKKISHSVFEDAEGYERARIPGIICPKEDVLIACCELRRDDSDWAVIDIGMKISTDCGKSWGERQLLISAEGKNTVNNPVMIADGEVIHFLYCLNYHQVFYKKSTDLGKTWGKEREITQDISESLGEFEFSCIATGPTHGISLSSGVLAVPLWMAYNREDPQSHHPSVIAVLYSRDNGESWRVGKISDCLEDPSEFCIAQTQNGKITANIRHEGAQKCRATAVIDENFTISDICFDSRLPDPVCCAGLCAYKNDLYFSNCADTRARKFLTLKKINGNNEICDSIMLSENAGYSDVAISPSGELIFVLSELDKSIIISIISP